MKYTHILWDFNGTLLDDVGICMETVNALLRSRNLPELTSREGYQRKFRFPIREYYAAVGFDFSKDPYEVLAQEWVDAYRAVEGTAPLFPGATAVLSALREQGIPQILFSATERSMLLQQVDFLGIGRYFEEILGNGDIYATGKEALGKGWMDRVGPPCALLIGDTQHDAQVASHLGIDCLLLSCGHHSEERLKETGFPVLKTLTEVPAYLNLL